MNNPKFGVVKGDKPEEEDGRPTSFSDDNIVTLSPDTIEDLKKRGLLRDAEEDIELPPFGPGMERVDTLNAEERMVFCDIVTSEAVLDDWIKEITARAHEKAAKHVRATNTPEQALEELSKDMIFESDDEAEEYYGEIYRKEVLSSMFWYNVRKRLSLFGANLAICHGFAVARGGYKYRVN